MLEMLDERRMVAVVVGCSDGGGVLGESVRGNDDVI
jgi:hypothetical protein